MKIVVKAMCIVRNGEKLLFSRGFDEVKGQAFLRPLGGHVKFGEKAEETIEREMKEELGCGVKNPRLLTVIENIFNYRGGDGHEIVFMFEGELLDKSFYEKQSFTFLEGKRETDAGWFGKVDVEKEGIPIYPPFEYFG